METHKVFSKSLAFSILLICNIYTNANAQQWIPAGSNSDGTSYIDVKSIKKDGYFRKAWLIQDRINPTKWGDKSYRAYVEYDCKNDRSRLLTLSSHSEKMATGNIEILINQTDPWSYVAPGTVDAAALSLVCSK